MTEITWELLSSGVLKRKHDNYILSRLTTFDSVAQATLYLVAKGIRGIVVKGCE